MKTEFSRGVARVWRVLSEVPGWPDAPFAVRFRRVLPLVIPCVAMLGLAGWKYGVRDPQIQAERRAHSHLSELEETVAHLRLAWSAQSAAEIAQRAGTVRAGLLRTAADATALWRRLHEEARALGWEATFQTYEAPVAEEGNAAPLLTFAAARAQLRPVPGNPARFASLLGVLGRFSAGDGRIDLTRLGVNADEPGGLVVELNLRAACRAP